MGHLSIHGPPQQLDHSRYPVPNIHPDVCRAVTLLKEALNANPAPGGNAIAYLRDQLAFFVKLGVYLQLCLLAWRRDQTKSACQKT